MNPASPIKTQVGKNVKKVKVGDKVGVGCIVDSCLDCQSCKKSEEQYCESGFTMTYDYKTVHGHVRTNSGYTFGGYSGKYTVREEFIVKARKTWIKSCQLAYCIWQKTTHLANF